MKQIQDIGVLQGHIPRNHATQHYAVQAGPYLTAALSRSPCLKRGYFSMKENPHGGLLLQNCGYSPIWNTALYLFKFP